MNETAGDLITALNTVSIVLNRGKDYVIEVGRDTQIVLDHFKKCVSSARLTWSKPVKTRPSLCQRVSG